MKLTRLLCMLLCGMLLLSSCGTDKPAGSSAPDGNDSSSVSDPAVVTTTTTENGGEQNATTSTLQSDISGLTTKTTVKDGLSSTQSNMTTTTKTNKTTAPTKGENNVDIPDYDPELYTRYFWEGNTVYYESVGFVETRPGKIASGKLLYTPTKVISVKSHDLSYTYKEGIDYVVEGNTIRRTEKSAIPYCDYDTYMPAYKNGTTDWLVSATDQSRYVGLNSDIRQYQVMVTYEHKGTWNGTKPTTQAKKLPRTMTKLKNKQALKIVYYGDSITAGFEASGVNELVLNKDTLQEYRYQSDQAPYMPAWATLVYSRLSVLFDHNAITKVNRGAGGADSNWGVANAGLVAAQNPDLVVIGFGMNEVGKADLTFKENVRKIIDTVRAKNAKADILLVSCMLPNEDAAAFAGHNLAGHEGVLYELANELSGVAVAPVYSVFKTLADNGKLYTDYTGNNLNHPNDFAIRVYAQTILATLEWPN